MVVNVAMAHQCPGPKCRGQAEVPPGKLLCPADWLTVPNQLRRAIYRASGEDGEGYGTAAHEAACRRAVEAIGGRW